MKKSDPTGTLHIRQRFRADAQRRLQFLLKTMRSLMVDADMFLLNPNQVPLNTTELLFRPMDNQRKLQMFSDWFNTAVYTYVVADGFWLDRFLQAAYASGKDAATQWTKIDRSPVRDAMGRELALRELQGIADATVQQVTRVVADGITGGYKSPQIYRAVHTIALKVGERRLNALCNYFTVKEHNVGRLDQFRLAGAKRFGLDAELKAGATTDALVEVLTAGDKLVCEECEDIAGDGPYEYDEAMQLIPAHPDCRCAWVPADDERFAPNEEQEQAAAETVF